MRKLAVILLAATTHAALSLGGFLLAFQKGMARFDAGGPTSMIEQALNIVVFVLHFPLVHLAQGAPRGWFSGLWGYVPILANSLLWSVMLVYVYFSLRARRAT